MIATFRFSHTGTADKAHAVGKLGRLKITRGHARASRAGNARRNERLDIAAQSTSHHFYCTIGAIAHPALQASIGGFTHSEITKAHSLHVAFDPNVHADDFVVHLCPDYDTKLR